MPEMDPKDPSTLYAAGPVVADPPADDVPVDEVPEALPLMDKGSSGPGPDDLDRLL
jgi:hypothetical protein